MKTLEELKGLTSKCLDGRDFNILAKFIPYNMIKDFGISPLLDVVLVQYREQPGRRVVRGLLQWPHGHRQQAHRRHGSDGN